MKNSMKRIIFLSLSMICCMTLAGQTPKILSSSAASSPANQLHQKRDKFTLLTDALFRLAPDVFNLITLETMDDINIASETMETLARLSDNESTVSLDFKNWQLASARDAFEYRIKWGLDATTDTLRHFYKINFMRYPSKTSISGYQLLVPAAQIPDDQLSSTLTMLSQKLRDGEFPREAYLFSMSFGKPSTGYFSDRPADQFSPAVREAFLSHPLNEVFGPLKTSDGFLFGMATDRVTSTVDFFDHYKNQVELDFRREWTKKILADYLTTESARHKLRLFDYSTTHAAPLEQTAYSLDGTTVTWQQLRDRFPHVLGDVQTQRYWHALRRRAVESHLIFLSNGFDEIEETPEYQQLKDAVASAAELHKTIYEQVQTLEPSDQELMAFVKSEPGFYKEPDIVSIRLYTCVDKESTAPATSDAGVTPDDCRLRLASIAGEIRKGSNGQLPSGLRIKLATDAPLDTLSREIQVALANNAPGYISPPFYMDGALYVAELTDRTAGNLPDIEKIRHEVLINYKNRQREKLWRQTLNLPQP